MEEKASANDQTVKVSRYNRDIALLTQRVSQLNNTLERVRSQHRTDSVALNIIKARFPKEYWSVVNGLKEEYARAGRLVSGEHGALGKAYSEVLERDGYRCARCNAFGVMLDGEGRLRRSILSIDHIHEKADGGGSSKENLQTLCNNCHGMKTRLSSALRPFIAIDRQKALIINERFLESREKHVGKNALRSALFEEFGVGPDLKPAR